MPSARRAFLPPARPPRTPVPNVYKRQVEILSPVPLGGKCGEKDYERLFIREAEVKAREGKMAYVRPEYQMCIRDSKMTVIIASM